MNDSNDFSGKNGKVKVMYVRSEEQDNKGNDKRRGGRDGGRDDRRGGSDKRGGDRRDGGRQERGGVQIALKVAAKNAVQITARVHRVSVLRGALFLNQIAKNLKMTMVGLLAKAKSTLSNCASNAKKRPEFTAKMRAKRCLKIDQMPLFAHGSCNLSPHVFVMP